MERHGVAGRAAAELKILDAQEVGRFLITCLDTQGRDAGSDTEPIAAGPCVRPQILRAERSSGVPHRLGSRRNRDRMQASPITITVTVAILASGCCVHAARAQQAPSVAASSPANPIDPLEGKVVREIRINPGLRPSTPDIVRRHLASRQGVPFHQATLAEDRRRLDALRLFSAVEIKRSQLATKSSSRSTSKRRCGSCRSSRSR